MSCNGQGFERYLKSLKCVTVKGQINSFHAYEKIFRCIKNQKLWKSSKLVQTLHTKSPFDEWLSPLFDIMPFTLTSVAVIEIGVELLKTLLFVLRDFFLRTCMFYRYEKLNGVDGATRAKP